MTAITVPCECIIPPADFEKHITGGKYLDHYKTAKKLELESYIPTPKYHLQTTTFLDTLLETTHGLRFNHRLDNSRFKGILLGGIGTKEERKFEFERMFAELTNIRGLPKTYVDVFFSTHHGARVHYAVRKGPFLKQVDFSQELPLSLFLADTVADCNSQPEPKQSRIPDLNEYGRLQLEQYL